MDDTHITLPNLAQRFQSLIWSCIDADLTRSAIFYAERYFAICQQSHEARHLYATALFRGGQPYSALCAVDLPRKDQCSGCFEMKAKCCQVLGRFRQARECLEEAMRYSGVAPSTTTPTRVAGCIPSEAAMQSRSGTMALKGNLHDQAGQSFRQALTRNPLIWEAFEGLCALGSVPEIDELFPPKPPPVKNAPQQQQQQSVVDEREQPSIKSAGGPIATGVGFFTPDPGGNGGGFFKGWKQPEMNQPFRTGNFSGPRDSLASTDSPFQFVDTTFHQAHRNTRSQPVLPTSVQQHVTRPLSSADEAGPMPKKLRSEAEAVKPLKSLKAAGEDISRKGSSRMNALNSKGNQTSTSNVGTRRSQRLQSTSNPKQPSKPSILRDRRRHLVHGRSKSMESDLDDDGFTGDIAYSPSPPALPHSPRSEGSPSPGNWTAAQERAAQEAYDVEMADHYIYDLMRRFAIATRALTLYDSKKCITELEQLPGFHQQTPWVLAMVGKAHYESGDYRSAERAFRAVRVLDPYRLWDMEVYSTLLWHLQQPVQLSFLAQELISIDPRSAEAWIAVGNLFSLQKERTQALTCFRRAFQLDPACAYAYTLSGHETIDDDPDKAITFFQSALRVDPRHYNAWYGLGSCYLRMSKLRLAEYHYRKAVEVHPTNAVLIGCVGMVVERRGDRNGAHALFEKAVKLAPENALVRYRRAKVYIAMKKYESAINDLEYLHRTSPEEANVVFQLAKVYRLVGDEVKSAQLLAIARDISPKSIGKIKKLLETVKDEMVEDKMDEG